jgi:adenylosuccinate synthase
MPITIVVGGQFGSEGKGKVAHHFAREMGASTAIRVGGPNSGHTVIDSFGQALILRQLPTASILPDINCVLAAGSYVNPEVLLAEMERTGLPEERLLIDPRAVVITEAEQHEEREGLLQLRIGSTETGTGAAVRRRISRTSNIRFAETEERLRPFVRPVSSFLRSRLECNERVIIEGTQGFGLSLLHSKYYPYVTSRDTTAAGFLSETGLSPLDVDCSASTTLTVDDNYIDRRSGLIINIIQSLFFGVCWLLICSSRIATRCRSGVFFRPNSFQ